MNLKKKIFGILASGMLLIPSVVNTIQPFTINAVTDAEAKYNANAEAASNPVKLIIHKIEATQEEFNTTPYENTGDIMPELEAKPKIAGVRFKLYNVTSYFNERLKTIASLGQSASVLNTTEEQRLAAYKQTVNFFKDKSASFIDGSEYASIVDPETGVLTSEAEGIATFTGVPQANADGSNRVYVIVESSTSGAHYAGTNNPVKIPMSVNTVIALPIIKDPNNDALFTASETDKEIDIYPKNFTDSKPDIAKELIPSAQDITDDSDGNGDGFVLIDDKDATNPPLGSTGNTSDPTVTRSIGELVEFKIDYKLPYDLASLVNDTIYKHSYFILNDLPDVGLNFFSTDKITVQDNPAEHTDFVNAKNNAEATYTSLLNTPLNLVISKYSNVAGSSLTANYADTRNLQFKFNMPTTVSTETTAKLQALAGKMITIKLKMIVAQDAPIEKSMNNLIKYKNHKNDGSGDNEGQDDSEFVIVFKKDFIKVNGRSDQLIKDGKAGFVVKRNDGKYFGGYTADGEVRWLTVTNPTQYKASDFVTGNVKGSGATESGVTYENIPVHVFWTTKDGTSADTITTGEINLPGLRKGTYQVEEVQAPDGYYLDDAATTISFTIDGSLNQSTYIGSGKTLEKIKNHPKGYLPSTGGIGIVIFLVIGISAMSVGGYMLVRNRKIKGNIV
ncbi:MAG: LPXTG cell wall anchor domain-containing protein [Lactobacillales bacterium]|jgi:LPXTG-motif cell wall-anchored protein|nr:LPXTG cell wall anchor domain-containing protein [Lactobacillales bacterium]